MEQHPTRQELIAAAQKESHGISIHLSTCEDCRALYELFRAFPLAGEIPLVEAPSGWVARANAIVNPGRSLARLKELVARLSFDSWSAAVAVEVRSQAVEQDRRLRFEIGKTHLDLRAEQTNVGWEFTGQLGPDNEFSSDTLLLADRKEIRQDSLGFFQWSSARPPKRLALRTGELQYALPELSWKRKPQQ